MPVRFVVSARAWMAVAALLGALAAPAVVFAAPAPPPVAPVEAAATPRIASQIAFDDLKRKLDGIALETHTERLSEDEFAALRRELQQVRDGVRAEIERLEPRLTEVEGRLNQLGPAPAAGAPPEDDAVAADRARLTRLRNNLDAALKQGRLLMVQGEQLADRINQFRRRAFVRELFARSLGAFDPALWRAAATATHDEFVQLRVMQGAWRTYARDNGGLVGAGNAVMAWGGLGAAGVLALRRARKRWAVFQPDTRFAKAEVALATLLRLTLAMPVAVVGAVIVLESSRLAPDNIVTLGFGLAAAVAAASFGRAVAIALLAPRNAA